MCRNGKRAGTPGWRWAAPTQVREEVRDVWLTRWLRDFVYDLRFSARSFLRSPSFTATAVLSLALGIGATTAIYSLVDQVVLRGLPVAHPERLVLVDWKGYRNGRDSAVHNLMSYPICRDLQQQERILRRRILPSGDHGEPLDGWRTRAGGRGNRFGHLLFGAGSGPRAGQAVDEAMTTERPERIRWLCSLTISGRPNSEARRMWWAERCW